VVVLTVEVLLNRHCCGSLPAGESSSDLVTAVLLLSNQGIWEVSCCNRSLKIVHIFYTAFFVGK